MTAGCSGSAPGSCLSSAPGEAVSEIRFDSHGCICTSCESDDAASSEARSAESGEIGVRGGRGSFQSPIDGEVASVVPLETYDDDEVDMVSERSRGS